MKKSKPKATGKFKTREALERQVIIRMRRRERMLKNIQSAEDIGNELGCGMSLVYAIWANR